VRLPEVEAIARERPHQDASPLELYKAYCERRHQAAPEPAVLDAFSELWSEVESASAGAGE
jgi:hypothetical protein